MLFTQNDVRRVLERSFPASGPGTYGEGKYKFVVKKSSINDSGNGLFWDGDEPIKKGQIIALYTGRHGPCSDTENGYIVTEGDFTVDGKPGQEVEEGMLEASVASYINDGKIDYDKEHSRQNCYYYLWEFPRDFKIENYSGTHLILVISKRIIHKKAEILISYGKNYWRKIFNNLTVDMRGFGVALYFSDNGRERVYLGRIDYLNKEKEYIPIWSDLDEGYPQIYLEQIAQKVKALGYIQQKIMKYKILLGMHYAGAGVFYPEKCQVVHPSVGKKVKSIKDSKWNFNGSITGFSEPGAREIFITLTESGREHKVTKSYFAANLDIIDTNKKSIKGLRIPTTTTKEAIYKKGDDANCESFLKPLVDDLYSAESPESLGEEPTGQGHSVLNILAKTTAPKPLTLTVPTNVYCERNETPPTVTEKKNMFPELKRKREYLDSHYNECYPTTNIFVPRLGTFKRSRV